MFIQGNIQVVFDALYEMGVINPALKADWAKADKNLKKSPQRLSDLIQVVNRNGDNVKTLIESLNLFQKEDLLYLAMEVARELVEFEDRKSIH